VATLNKREEKSIICKEYKWLRRRRGGKGIDYKEYRYRI